MVNICLIFQILPSTFPFTYETPHGHHITSRFLAYVRRYDILPQQNGLQRGMFPDPNTGLFLLKKATHSTGELAGDIIPLDQIQLRSMVDLAPRFGAKANAQLTNTTSMAYSTEFWLNKYFNKELFHIFSP